jgi:hypothetical protein
MAWVPVNRSVFTHRKTMKLADLLDIPEVYAVAHLTALWTWAMDNAPSGFIAGDTSARMIARAAEFPGNAQVFLEALLESDYLVYANDAYELPNWMEYGGKLVTQQSKNAEKQARYREKKDASQNVTVTLPSHNQPVTAELPSREEEKRKEEIIPLTPAGGEAQTITNGKVFSECGPLPTHTENYLRESCPDWWEAHLRLALAGRQFTSTAALDSYAMQILRGWKKGKDTPQAPLPDVPIHAAPPDTLLPPGARILSMAERRAKRAAQEAIHTIPGGSHATQ